MIFICKGRIENTRFGMVRMIPDFLSKILLSG